VESIVKATTFKRLAKSIPAQWLPFADVASAGLPLSRLLRLSLFKVTMGITTALLIGTLNRVMIVELGVTASLVSLMLALPLLVAPFRAVTGYQSDTHQSAFGWKRVPYMWGGTLVQFLGLAFMPFALLALSGQGQTPLPSWLAQGVAAMAFLMVGAGLQTSQTAGLALATDQASEETRPRVVALMYIMLLTGAVGGSLIFSVLLTDFSPQRLVQVVQGTAMVVLCLNAFALWKQEPRNPQRAAARRQVTRPSFKTVWANFINLPKARRFLWTTGLGTLAFNMQDVVLEPYGGEILHLSVGATSALTAMLAGGALLGFVLAGRQLARGMDPLLLAARYRFGYSCVLSDHLFSTPGSRVAVPFRCFGHWFGRWTVCCRHSFRRHAPGWWRLHWFGAGSLGRCAVHCCGPGNVHGGCPARRGHACRRERCFWRCLCCAVHRLQRCLPC